MSSATTSKVRKGQAWIQDSVVQHQDQDSDAQDQDSDQDSGA